MSLGHGAKIVTDGLKFLWDPNSPKCTNNNRTGVVGNYSTASNYVDAISSNFIAIGGASEFSVTGKTYYTIVGVAYPEGSQAAPWAGRDGVTPGISNTSAGKLYDFSRDVNYIVFDEDTNTWVPDSYFNGERVNGHCYDTYDGQPAQHATFQADFDNISSSFPNATHIVVGSHAAANDDSDAATVARLKTIGLPDSHLSYSGHPEYVLVGKVNRPSTWHYVRENVNSAIGVMNVGLPLENSLYQSGAAFNNSSWLDLPADLGYGNNVTVCAWFKSNGSPAGGYHIICGGSELEMSIPTAGQLRCGVQVGSTRRVFNSGGGLTDGQWHFLSMTIDATTLRAYIDGNESGTYAIGGYGNVSSVISTRRIGRFGSDANYYLNGDLGSYQVYNKTLTALEIKQNFEAHRARYGI
jgi:hypothetical protein